MQPRWLEPTEERAWRGYRQVRRLLDLEINRDLAESSGLSEPDYDVLSTLTEVEGHRWRATELAARLLWSTSRLSHHLRRMEQRGLVGREECPEDGRGAVVTLTDRGWRTIQEAAPAHVESVRRHFVDVLTEAQLESLDEICRTLVAHLAGR